jgi:hypothetical protein
VAAIIVATLGPAFWTISQLLTVSSQIKNPISVGKHILDVFMDIYAGLRRYRQGPSARLITRSSPSTQCRCALPRRWPA